MIQNRLSKIRFPPKWYKLDPELNLVANATILRAYLCFSILLSAAAFVVQLIVFTNSFTSEIIIHSEYMKEGYACRPLIPEPSYKLRITYDECMNDYYIPPSQANLLQFGRYDNYLNGDGGMFSFESRDEMKKFYRYTGPWNFTSFFGKAANGEFAAVYHRPFSREVSNVSYTFSTKCKIPRWKGYEENVLYDPDISYQQPLEESRENAKANSINFYSGYGGFGLSNFNVSWDEYLSKVFDDQREASKLIKFEVNKSVSYTEKCGDAFASVENDLFLNNTWAFPKVWGSDMTYTIFNQTSFKVEYTLRLTDRSVGITALYPERSSKEALGVTSYTNNRIDDTSIQCDFYERQVALEAYQYIYSWRDCHPCDVFKYAGPFECERKVRKTVPEILSLSAANTMALWGALVAAGPLVLASRIFQPLSGEADDGVNDGKDEIRLTEA